MPVNSIRDIVAFDRLPADETCLQMCEWNKTIYVLTTKRLYRFADGRLHPVSFVMQEKNDGVEPQKISFPSRIEY